MENISGWVLFSADWCTPCKRLKPFIKDYIDYEVDLSEGIPTDVRAVPTIRYYENGQVLDEIISPSPAAFRQWRGI